MRWRGLRSPPSVLDHWLLVLAQAIENAALDLEVSFDELVRRLRHPLRERDIDEMSGSEQLEEAQGFVTQILMLP